VLLFPSHVAMKESVYIETRPKSPSDMNQQTPPVSGMMLFHQLVPSIGLKETRTVTISDKGSLPGRSFGFVELYCVDPECDCSTES
jgi:hypothetical protein